MWVLAHIFWKAEKKMGPLVQSGELTDRIHVFFEKDELNWEIIGPTGIITSLQRSYLTTDSFMAGDWDSN